MRMPMVSVHADKTDCRTVLVEKQGVRSNAHLRLSRNEMPGVPAGFQTSGFLRLFSFSGFQFFSIFPL
jgi:hypothetical protein